MKQEIKRDDINENIVLFEQGVEVGEYNYEDVKDWLITMFNYTVTDDLRNWKVGGSEDDEAGWTTVSDEMLLQAIKA